jgi:hypothetical protein
MLIFFVAVRGFQEALLASGNSEVSL